MTQFGYKGSLEMGEACFFCLYRPGMTVQEIAKVEQQIADHNKPRLDIQQQIMHAVRNV